MKIVAKFGGTSMATAESIRRVAKILQQNSARSIAVVSAPGATVCERKVTDLLIAGDFTAVEKRFCKLMEDLGLEAECFRYLYSQLILCSGSSNVGVRAYLGEHLSAYILAMVTRRRFVDATEVIHFDYEGNVEVHTPWQDGENVVIPGFYGYSHATYSIALFPRGGSDISAAYIAATTQADVYENCTDVSGVYCSDPRQNPEAKKYDYLSHTEMTVLAKGGAQVFHPDALHPVRNRGIPVIIKNTFAPHEQGTVIPGPR